MRMSIAIPTYESKGRGVEFLDDLFRTIEIQTFKDFEVVVSDHSAGFGGTKDATRSLMNSSQINRKDETVTTPNTDTEQGAYPQQASFGVESTVQYIYSASPKLHKVSLY